MTAHKHLKQIIRNRMKKTGERYAAARRQVLLDAPPPARDPAARWHFAGNVAATTALRILLAHAGVRAPHTRQPYSEALLFGIAGGIGVGACSFYYAKEGIATFFLAGRHCWHDDLLYLRQAAARLGVAVTVRESGGAGAAAKQLRETLAQGPCIAWVDAAHLPHRALPAAWSGGGYHVVTLYRIDDAAQTALMGDLTDEPIAIPLADLAAARGRIRKQKHRLLSMPPAEGPADLAEVVRQGLRACHHGLVTPGIKGWSKNMVLDTFRLWGERLHGSSDKESWERIFTPGRRLWRGLVALYDFIEHYGTGGGLCRPLYADFLTEAADALAAPQLRDLAGRYAELGRAWSALAEAALPEDVPELREARELHARKAELTHSGSDPAAIREIWERLDALERQADEHFPLSDADCAALRANLQGRVFALHEGEVAAHAALGKAAS